MPVLLRIAVRNLKEHKSKTLIIGLIISLGIAVLLTGNALMDTAQKGIEKLFIDNYSGHLMIKGTVEDDLSIFGFQDMTKFSERIPVIREYEKIADFVGSHPSVKYFTPLISSRGLITTEDRGSTLIFLFGVEPQSYRELFSDNIELLEGRFLLPGEEGIVISEKSAAALREEHGLDVHAGDSILVSNIPGFSGIKIRELIVRGIFRFKNSNTMLDRISFIDAENDRVLNGMTVGGLSEQKTDMERFQNLEYEDEESLFGEDVFAGDIAFTEDDFQETESALMEILSDSKERKILSTPEAGTWNFIIIRLDDSADLGKTQNDINSFLVENGLFAGTSDWIESAGAMARISFSIQGMFNIVIIVIAIVAVIIIMNTLVVSILERTGEIGTIRTLGGRKIFVLKMILLETMVISVIFGVAGIILGSGIIYILNLTGLEAGDPFVEILFGGKVLRPVINAGQIFISLSIVTLIGLVSSVYPTMIALRIKPLTAIQDH